MLKSLLFSILVLTVISCAKSSDSNSNPPPNNNKQQEESPTTTKKETPSPELGLCPFIEMQGTYVATKIECTIDKRDEVAADPKVVPQTYTISKDDYLNDGVMKLGFKFENGEDHSLSLYFPRQPTQDDFRKKGIQCGMIPSSKSLVQNCQSLKPTCTYALLEKEGKYTSVFYEFRKGRLYSCRSELTKIN